MQNFINLKLNFRNKDLKILTTIKYTWPTKTKLYITSF